MTTARLLEVGWPTVAHNGFRAKLTLKASGSRSEGRKMLELDFERGGSQLGVV